jgi:hypothetical protein
MRDIDLPRLAGIADALAASGRSDLAAYIVEILYYCGERRTHGDRVVPFPRRPHNRRFHSLRT